MPRTARTWSPTSRPSPTSNFKPRVCDPRVWLGRQRSEPLLPPGQRPRPLPPTLCAPPAFPRQRSSGASALQRWARHPPHGSASLIPRLSFSACRVCTPRGSVAAALGIWRGRAWTCSSFRRRPCSRSSRRSAQARDSAPGTWDQWVQEGVCPGRRRRCISDRSQLVLLAWPTCAEPRGARARDLCNAGPERLLASATGRLMNAAWMPHLNAPLPQHGHRLTCGVQSASLELRPSLAPSELAPSTVR